jgi:hypothetical protein
MSRFTGILLGTLIVLALGAITVANAAVAYEAILEWNGPYFKIINNATVDQKVNTPVADIPFVQPYAVAAREHNAVNKRDVVYVADSGHNRVQAFEVNAGYYNDNTFDWTEPAVGIDDFDNNEIRLHEYHGTATDAQWVVPGSESVIIGGEAWARVADVTLFAPADKVYSIDYSAANGPIIRVPDLSLTTASTISLRYALSNYQGTDVVGGIHIFGAGDVDYGVDNGLLGGAGTKTLAEIDETVTNGPSTWGVIRSIAAIASETPNTSDDIFLIDAVDATEQLFSYNVTSDGTVAAIEEYDDVLTTPYDVAVGNCTPGNLVTVAASATISNDTGPFEGVAPGTITIVPGDEDLVTGHTYSVVYTDNTKTVTITDVNTGLPVVTGASIVAVGATATINADTGPFEGAAPGNLNVNVSANVTGHAYSIAYTRATHTMVITDQTTLGTVTSTLATAELSANTGVFDLSTVSVVTPASVVDDTYTIVFNLVAGTVVITALDASEEYNGLFVDLPSPLTFHGVTLTRKAVAPLGNSTTTLITHAGAAANPYLGVPGLSLPYNVPTPTAAGGAVVTTVITTVHEVTDDIANPYLGIPGLSLADNDVSPVGSGNVTATITTVAEVTASATTEIQAAAGLGAVVLPVSAASVRDASQVTGHVYTVNGAGGNIVITDVTTGQVLVSSTLFANVASPCLAIPGITFTLAAGATTSTLTTVKEVTDRYLFVADTGNDRIKVVAASDDVVDATDDWLPGDIHEDMVVQPGAAVGATANLDYFYTTPALVGPATTIPEDYAVYTLAFPIKEGTLEGIQMPADAAAALVPNWTRVDDLVTAGPTDQVYTVDWTTGKITFGDGVHGEIPPAASTFEFEYTTTPDVLRYGSSGTGPGRFSAPRGIAARWNASLGVFDVYVADTGNNRIQKLAFTPANATLNLPARMDFVCEWNVASTATDLLNNPVDIAVMVDGSTPALCYLAVADQGNDRVVTYEDVAATSGGGSAAPTWDAVSGALGNNLGLYTQVDGVCFLPNGNDLDLYVCDGQRGVVTKYEESIAPTIELSLGNLAPPFDPCRPQSSSYVFTVVTTNPPVGGTIEFWYGTEATFDEATAKLCFPADSIQATATTATWIFADTPGGAPADRSIATGGYYLFARMKDSSGILVASDASTGTGDNDLLCMDSTLLPGFRGVDRIDGDRTLYLQNGLERVVDLTLAFPENIIGVAIGGAFPDSIIEVTAIDPGNGWDGTNYINTIFNQGFSVAPNPGTFLVNTSITGSPLGLSIGATSVFTMAEMTVKSKTDVLSPTRRFLDGTITILKANSGMVDNLGASPAAELWTTRNVNLRWGYLGDLATSGIGADSTLPNLVVDPDGLINFEDQMVLTLGWNGVNNVQDRIADIGPTEGTVPNLRPIPDGKWNVDDLLAFTVMYSWAADAGYYKDASGLLRTNEPRPVALGAPVLGAAAVRSVSVLGMPKAGEFMTVDLNVDGVRDLSGALINVGFDPARLELVSVENGGFLDGKSGSLFFKKSGQGWLEVSTTRLDQERPGVSGGGTVARATFRILDENAGDLSVQYDLRSATGKVLGRGTSQAGAYTGGAVGFQLYAAHPNPTRGSANIVYSVPTATNLSLNVYDVTGRQVRSLFSGRREAGYHVAPFDGRDDAGNSLAGGIYFYRLQANGKTATQKLTLSR